MKKLINSDHSFIKTAYQYLLSFPNIDERLIDLHVYEWKLKRSQNMADLFKTFLIHARNRQGMPNSIGDIGNLAPFLFEFDHKQILENYKTWDNIFDIIDESEYNPPGRMDRNNNRSHWVIYCKSILSIAEFLRPYSKINDFNKFVEQFLHNEHSRLALPLLISAEIFGFGFALACDFLKDNISPMFVKPDVHINEISLGLGITKSNNDFVIFKDFLIFCKRNELMPYEADKLFWLIGSGNFYLKNVIIQTSKNDFIKAALLAELAMPINVPNGDV